MTLNLLIDTTHRTLMMAIADDRRILASYSQAHTSHRYHSSMMLPQLEALLEQHHHTLHDITGIGVNLGPGSFTGIRTGLTVARLMGQFLPVETYGFNTFELMAGALPYRTHTVTVVLDAFRQQHYQASLEVDKTGEIRWLNAPAVYNNTNAVESTAPHCLIEGSLKDKIQVTHPNPQYFDDSPVFSPEVMQFYLQHHPERHRYTWEELKPLYLQLPHITLKKATPPC